MLTYRYMSSIPPTSHKALIKWVKKMVTLCEPKNVHWCNGSNEEADQIFSMMEAKGMCIKLNQKKFVSNMYQQIQLDKCILDMHEGLS